MGKCFDIFIQNIIKTTTKTKIDSQHNYTICLQMLGIKDVNVNLPRLEITSGHYCIPMNPNERML